MQFIRNMRMRTKLTILLICVGFASVIAVSIIAWFSTQSILRDQAFDQLVSVREDRVDEVESYFDSLRAELFLLSQDKTLAVAMSELRLAFQELDEIVVSEEVENAVEQFYKTDFLPSLETNLRQQLEPSQYMPDTSVGVYLQNQYIASNDNLLGNKHFLDYANDGSGYSDAHRQYHPFFRTFVTLFGYYDLFLVEPVERNIVYSVYKEVDFATNLSTGAYATSGLAEAVDKVLQNPEQGQIQVVDFQPYDPSYQEPASFFAIPIFQDDVLLGVLAIQVPVDELNNIMTSRGQWQEHGLGDSGETYLVGGDRRMRSMSRLLVEDKAAYISALATAGVDQAVRDNVNNLGTSILQQEINTTSAENALAGQSGIHVIEDYSGTPVLSAYAPLMVEGLDWVVIAEIAVAEINAPIIQQQSFFLLAAGCLAALLLLLSLLIANQYTHSIRKLTRATREISAGNLAIEAIPVASKDEVGQLANAFNQMAISLREQRETMQSTVKENERLLLSILPAPIAKRVKDGEGDIAEEVTNVSLMFAHLYNIHAMILHFPSRKQAAESLNMLSERLEYTAIEHGVERQPTISNHYVAVCGLNNDGDDHVERIVRYALACRQLVETFNQEHGVNLILQMGIHTGTVLAALLDENRFRFDLWGLTVEIADKMEAAAQPGMILVSHEVYEIIQDKYRFLLHEPIAIDDDRRWRVWQLLPPDSPSTADGLVTTLAEMGRSGGLPSTLRPRRQRAGLRRFGRKKV